MRALVQRVSEASVSVAGQKISSINKGLLVLLGVGSNDTPEIAEALARKVCLLRIFPDETGGMTLNTSQAEGELLIVSQFTLYADTRRGNRPSFLNAARAELAESLYHEFVKTCAATGLRVKTGVFQANMDVQLINQGPVTLLCELESAG